MTQRDVSVFYGHVSQQQQQLCGSDENPASQKGPENVAMATFSGIGLNLIAKLSWIIGNNNHNLVFYNLCVVGLPSLFNLVSSFLVHEKTMGCVSPRFDLLCVGRRLSRRIPRKTFSLSNPIPV